MIIEKRVINELKESEALRQEARKEITTVMLRYAQNLQNEVSALEQLKEEICQSPRMDCVTKFNKKALVTAEIDRCKSIGRYYEDIEKIIESAIMEEKEC